MLNIKQTLVDKCAIYNKEASKEMLNIKQNLANKCAIYNKEANKEMLNIKQRLANRCAIYNKEAKKETLNIKNKIRVVGLASHRIDGLIAQSIGPIGQKLIARKGLQDGKDIKLTTQKLGKH